MAKLYDILVIGAGAGGGTLAWRMANDGKSVLLLERGSYLPQLESWRDGHSKCC